MLLEKYGFLFQFREDKIFKGEKIQGMKDVKANSKTGKVLNLSTIYKNFSFCNKRTRALTIQTLCVPAISKCGIQTSSTSSTRELVRNAHSWVPPRPTELETLGMGATTCFLTRATGDTTEWLALSHYHYPGDFHTGWNLRITDLFQKHLSTVCQALGTQRHWGHENKNLTWLIV